MKAIYSRELDSYFHNLTAYIYSAFLLVFVGLAALVYNINGAVANFEYVLAAICLGLALVVPILTMRSITEERRQKTDQLLYSLPLNMYEIVIGKYLAMLTVFAIPMIVICVYPLLFSKYGDVYLLTSYCCIFAFVLLGAAWLSVGIFISSLTDKLAVSAGGTALVILANYYMTNLGDKLTGTFGEFIAKVLTELSLFEHFYTFVNGIFDITSVVFFISIVALFLFLTVMSMEKRRYS